MSIVLFSIASSLHDDLPAIGEDAFIEDIQRELGERFAVKDGFTDYYDCREKLIYIRTGGSEEFFKALNLKGDIRLLTSGKENSLAAAMEILSYVNSRGGRGEILHGTASEIAFRLKRPFPVGCPSDASDASATVGKREWIRPLPVDLRLDGVRIGVIGAPSDWLIASGVDYSKACSRLGVEMVDIPIEELVDEIKKSDCDLRSFQGSEAVYETLKIIAAKYALNALTLRCFDLLSLVGNTGCLALARLNSEGIVSSCEGDIPALITMLIAAKLTGCPGFQCNLSRISGDELLFAHCTVPLSMVESYTYTTHFESGIGTAIKAELPLGKVTIFKVAPDLERMALIPAELVRNQSESGLCRTQVIVKVSGAAGYFLKESLANHHIIVLGTLFD